MTNSNNTIIYVGVTANLQKRVYEHRSGINKTAFTFKYNCNKLVYYKAFERIEDAIAEEKRIKGGSRKKKIELIIGFNPEWKDLWEEVQSW